MNLRISYIKKKNRRRLLATVLFLTLALTALTACSKSGVDTGSGNNVKDSTGANSSSGGTSAKGRYIEEDMELPISDGEEVLNLTRTTDGAPVLFTCVNAAQVNRYEYNGKDWSKTALDWLAGVYPDSEVIPMEVQETAEGVQYVRGMDEEQTHIARGGNGQEGEELQIPYLTEQAEIGYPIITGMLVDDAGNYWLQSPYEGVAAVIAGDTLEVLEELPTSQLLSMMDRLIFQGNGMVAVNTEDNVYTVYEKNREQKGTFSVKKKGAAWMCGGEDHWYYISEEGITRLTLGNDTQEVIMDGSLGAMGSTVNTVMGAVRGNEDDFYILYNQYKAGTDILKHYVYDPEAAAVPETTLQVFGLLDSDTVREAAIGFQKKHPDVKVEFTTSGKQAGEVTSDDIRTLNTELLSGNGADVLLLDGLPMNAYIEKGILADLSETAEEIMEAGTYLEDILKNTAQKDGKLYGLPIKFSVPVLYGNEDAKKALESFDNKTKGMGAGRIPDHDVSLHCSFQGGGIRAGSPGSGRKAGAGEAVVFLRRKWNRSAGTGKDYISMGRPAGRMGGGDRKRGESWGMPDPISNGIFTAGHPEQAGRADTIGGSGAAAGNRSQGNRAGAVGGEGAPKSGGCAEKAGRCSEKAGRYSEEAGRYPGGGKESTGRIRSV